MGKQLRETSSCRVAVGTSTSNMEYTDDMVVTLDVSRLSGWLNADAEENI